MYKLCFVRHGESAWISLNRFCGWVDVDLTEAGRQEARDAAEAIKAEGLEFGHVFTSVLKRSLQTSAVILETMQHPKVPESAHWRLNERHYGALQGLNRVEVAEKYGEEQVKLWRRSFDVPPPPCSLDSEYYPGNDPRYKDIPKDEIPNGESLQLTIKRVLPYFEQHIVPELKKHKAVLVVAHGNSLRGLMMHLEKLTPEEISKVNLPTGVPLVYDLDENLNVVAKKFLIDEETLKAKMDAVAAQTKKNA